MGSENPTYYLICLHEPCSQKAADFIATYLTKKLGKGGAELIVKQEKMSEGRGGLVLHITASPQRLFEIAEDMELKIRDTNEIIDASTNKVMEKGVIRPFIAREIEQFPQDGAVGPLNLAQVQKCIIYAMELVHFDEETKTLPGCEKRRIMPRAPVLSSYQEAGLLDMFPLHDDEMLRKLYAQWARGVLNPFKEPPVDEIRNYFGENVALYIAFTSYYTKFLVPMAILGILHYCLDRFLRFDFIYNNVIFACINLVSVTFFLELWKRKSSTYSFRFGTLGKLRHKRPRPAFRGIYGLNPITGKDEVQYPISETMKTLFFKSVPMTTLCLIIAFILMILSFESEKWLTLSLTDPDTGLLQDDVFSQMLMYCPSIIYSVLVMLMNLKYLQLAHGLTEEENHRTQEQFERHVVAKLVAFEFCNTFLSLFYIAFYIQDINMLKSQLFTMLIVTQLVNQLQETILPYLLKRPSPRRMMNKIAKKIHLDGKNSLKYCNHRKLECVECLPENDNEIHHAMFSLRKDPYESTYDDFMELWLQFGHVFLFSSVYPLAAFFALINNFVELKMDAFKMCKVMRKPTPRGVRDIGAWYMAFSITSVISVMTNLTLLAMDKDVQAFAPQASSRDWVLLFVLFEHLFLLIRVIIETSISDMPKKVKNEVDRNEFRLKNIMK